MAIDETQISEGMRVYGSDGHRLGKVIETGARTFAFEKGFFFPKDYLVAYDDIDTVDAANAIHLSLTREELDHGASAGTAAVQQRATQPAASKEQPQARTEEHVVIEDVDEVIVVERAPSRVDLHVTTHRGPAIEDEGRIDPPDAGSDEPAET